MKIELYFVMEGPGNTADDYEDLGAHPEEDKCCRRHDHW